jgi:hypothetical protein
MLHFMSSGREVPRVSESDGCAALQDKAKRALGVAAGNVREAGNAGRGSGGGGGI